MFQYFRFLMLTLFMIPAFSFAAGSTKGNFKFHVNSNGDKQESVVLWQDTVVQEGERVHSLVVLNGNVDVYGEVDDLVVVAGKVHLHSSAKVNKDIVVIGGKLETDPGAQVDADRVSFEMGEDFPNWMLVALPAAGVIFSTGGAILAILVKALLFWVIGMLIYLVFPKFMADSERMLSETTMKSFLWSIGGAIFFIPGLIALVITLIGIFFIPIYVMFYTGLYFVAGILVSALIGKKCSPGSEKFKEPQWFLLIGVMCVSVVALIPMLGALALFIFSCIAWGALIAVIIDRIKGSRSHKELGSAA